MIKTVWKYGDSDIDDARFVRLEVFVKEQNVPPELEWVDLDKVSKHVLIYEDEKCIATGRMYVEDNGVFHIGRVAVLKEWRGQYIGDMVMRALLNSAFYFEGASVVEISAQLTAVPFYERFGFVAFGNTYMDAGIEHVSMRVTKDTVVFGKCCR